MTPTIIPSDSGHPEIYVWTTHDHPVTGLTVFAPFVNLGISFTRFQMAQLIAALQDADAELAAREAEQVSA